MVIRDWIGKAAYQYCGFSEIETYSQESLCFSAKVIENTIHYIHSDGKINYNSFYLNIS